MYTDFYGLKSFPFQLTPDFRFFFDSRPHRKAMAYLSYGLSKGEGFIVITGEIGAGKTTLIDYLLSTLEGKNIATARIVTTQIQANDLLRMVASSFGITDAKASKAALLNQIETFLLANHRANKRSFLVIDEVQSLASSSLEELRMLSNFGIGQQPILQICLVGQPEFRKTLASDRLEQLRQRIIASHHLVPLDAEETRGYIEHRLRRVGWRADPVFTDGAFEKIFEASGGVPRKINVLCDRILLYGYLEERHELTGEDVSEVVIDMRQESLAPSPAAATVRRETKPRRAVEPVVAPAANASDLDAVNQRLANLERLLTLALTQGSLGRPLEAEATDESTREPTEVDRLLDRVATLEDQLKRGDE